MYTNICHNLCDPKGSRPVKLILNNCVYIDELCVVKEYMTTEYDTPTNAITVYHILV